VNHLVTTLAPVVNTLPDEVHEIFAWPATRAADDRITATTASVATVEFPGSACFCWNFLFVNVTGSCATRCRGLTSTVANRAGVSREVQKNLGGGQRPAPDVARRRDRRWTVRTSRDRVVCGWL